MAAELNPNSPDPTGLREAIINECYPDIFRALRLLPTHVQERLLIQGYTEPGVKMPNGDKLARELVRINNIKWFEPTEQVSKNFILEKTDVMVFGGGDTYHLLEWIRKSGLKKELPRLLRSKVYVGISAGSMVTSKKIALSTAGILYYEKHGVLEDKNGLGLVDFELRPHLNSDWFPKVRLPYLKKLANKASYSFYAIDDDTAVKVVNDKVSVVTEGKWKKFN